VEVPAATRNNTALVPATSMSHPAASTSQSTEMTAAPGEETLVEVIAASEVERPAVLMIVAIEDKIAATAVLTKAETEASTRTTSSVVDRTEGATV